MSSRTRIGFLAGCLVVTVLAGPRAASLAVDALGGPYAGGTPHETVASNDASHHAAIMNDVEEENGEVR